jgi:hypothetical protein
MLGKYPTRITCWAGAFKVGNRGSNNASAKKLIELNFILNFLLYLICPDGNVLGRNNFCCGPV